MDHVELADANANSVYCVRMDPDDGKITLSSSFKKNEATNIASLVILVIYFMFIPSEHEIKYSDKQK